MMKITTGIILTLAVVVAAKPWKPLMPSIAQYPDLFVAPNGSDDNPGTPGRPLATLEGARKKVRELKAAKEDAGIVVEFAAGTYRFTEPVVFTQEDSGTAIVPVTYRAAYGAEVRWTGSQVAGALKPVQDASVKAVLLPEVVDRVMESDLSSISDLGTLRPYGFGTGRPAAEAELFYDDQPMQLARWPKTDFIGVSEKIDMGNFVLKADGRTQRWKGERDPWIFAYYHHDWAEIGEPVLGFGPKTDQVRRNPNQKAVYGITPERVRAYMFNLLSEVSEPGDYYIDRTAKKLYFIPPKKGGSLEVSVAEMLVRGKNASFLHFEGIIFENVRGSAFSLVGNHNHVVSCVIRNTGTIGGTFNGSENLLYGCDIYDTGAGGVSLYGGDRKTLTNGNNNAENNHVHHYSRRNRTYTTGLRTDGCGNRLAHNLIHHGPHMAIASGGNEHVVEFNEIHNAVYESGDAGAFYVGRDWTQRGNKVNFNYWHNIMGSSSYGGMTIYLDDQHSGYEIYGNLFEACNSSVFIGGGCDNVVDNNVFVDCWKSGHLDNRGMGWQKKATDDKDGELRRYLRNMPYQSELWAKRYPTLVNILDDDPGVPKRNVFVRNVSAGGRWYDINNSILQYQTVKDNVVFDDEPDWIKLKKDSTGKVIDIRYKDQAKLEEVGFKQIPFEKMGLYKDPRRASWPIQRTIDKVVLPHHRQPKVTKAKLSPLPTIKVPKAKKPSAVMDLSVNYNGEKAEDPPRAKLAHDGKNLIIDIESFLPKARKLGEGWAGNEAVELAFIASDGANSDIYVFRGFTTGKFEGFKLISRRRAEAPVLQQAKLEAKVSEKSWSCRWIIPLELIGVTVGDRLWANITVRRTATNQFIMWRPTNGDSTNCDRVGFLELTK
jgi:hypothetical protein